MHAADLRNKVVTLCPSVVQKAGRAGYVKVKPLAELVILACCSTADRVIYPRLQSAAQDVQVVEYDYRYCNVMVR